MKRRTVFGLISAAVTGSVAIGSGAFTSVEAERDITVKVAGDDSALLQLEPTDEFDANYATISESSDLIQFDINDVIHDDDGGFGPGSNSVYTFENLFKVKNAGTQMVYLEAEFEDIDSIDGIDLIFNDNTENPLNGDDAVVEIGVGDDIEVGLHIDTAGVDVEFTSGDQVNAVPDDITAVITADSENPDGVTVLND